MGGLASSLGKAHEGAIGLSARDSLSQDSGRPFSAHWEIDLTRVTSLIAGPAQGSARKAGWVDALLNGARIADLDECAAQVVGAPVGRDAMIGQPVASFAPPDNWEILARLIAEVAADVPAHGARQSPINSFMLRGALLRVWGAAGREISSRVHVAVEGVVADDRSPWAVRASEQRYRRLIHHLPTALLQVDARALDTIFHQLRADGVLDIAAHMDAHPDLIATARRIVRVTDANEGAVQLMGAADASTLIGPVDYLFHCSPDSAKRVVAAHFEGRRNHSELIRLRTLGGELLDVELSVTYPNPPERLDVTLITLEDVTDRLKTESQLRQLQADYGRATRIATLGELASSIAHEVNQPLAAIAMNAETSLRWLARDDPNLAKVAQLTERVAASARHASEIVQRIRGMAARHAPECAPLNLNEVVKESLLFVQHDLESRNIRLESSLMPRLPLLRGDRIQLQQVVVNLLVNAVQAVAQQAPERRRIKVQTQAKGDGAIMLEVHDHGPGIADDDLERIFEGFYTTKADGMGIGLAVCQSIIHAHGGKIVAKNAAHGGALFRVSIPQNICD